MDLAMPVMDGWEATRRLKANDRTAGIPVVALSGDVRVDNFERAKKSRLRCVRGQAVLAGRSRDADPQP